MSRRHCAMCIADGENLNDTRLLYVGLARIAVPDASARSQSYSWKYMADCGFRDG